jgi:hypothetical protein
MKQDIVETLRTWKGKALTPVIMNKAADEIERLRKIIESLSNNLEAHS